MEWDGTVQDGTGRDGMKRNAKAAVAKAQEQDDKRVDHLSKNTTDHQNI